MMGCTKSKAGKGANPSAPGSGLPQFERKIKSINARKHEKSQEFSGEELEHICSVWGNLRMNHPDAGLFLLEKMFLKYPELAKKFDFCRDFFGSYKADAMQTEFMKNHSIKIMNALDTVIAGITAQQPMREAVREIGRDHYHKKIDKIHMRQMADGMLEGLKEVIGDAKDSTRKLLAWNKLFDMIVEEFGNGLFKAEEEELSAVYERESRFSRWFKG